MQLVWFILSHYVDYLQNWSWVVLKPPNSIDNQEFTATLLVLSYLLFYFSNLSETPTDTPGCVF